MSDKLQVQVTDAQASTLTVATNFQPPVRLKRCVVHLIIITHKTWCNNGKPGEDFDVSFYGRKLTKTGKEDMRSDTGYLSSGTVQEYAVGSIVLRAAGRDGLAERAWHEAQKDAERSYYELGMKVCTEEEYVHHSIARALMYFDNIPRQAEVIIK